MNEGDQMATMTRWDPFQDLRSAQEEMAQMSPMLAHALGLHAQQGSGRATPMAWAPALDISERKDAYLVTVELPGVEADDLEITMEDGLLTIQGERSWASIGLIWAISSCALRRSWNGSHRVMVAIWSPSFMGRAARRLGEHADSGWLTSVPLPSDITLW